MIHNLHKKAGFTPMAHRVLLRVTKIEEKTAGGIILPDNHKKQLEYAMLNAEILCIGETAFLEHYIKPKVGMGVKIVRHAGHIYDGEDGEDYRVVNDTDIVAFDDVIDVDKETEKAIKLEKKDKENE